MSGEAGVEAAYSHKRVEEFAIHGLGTRESKQRIHTFIKNFRVMDID